MALEVTRLPDKALGWKPEWREWLHQYDLWEGTDEDAMYLRYMKLSRLKFPVVPHEHWKWFYHDLFPLEHGLVFGNAIGRADRFAYRFQVTDACPIRHKAFGFPKAERLL